MNRTYRCHCPDCACTAALVNVRMDGYCPSCSTWRALRLDGSMPVHMHCTGVRFDGGWSVPAHSRIAALCEMCRQERHAAVTAGVGNRRLALLLEEGERRPLAGQEAML